MGPSSSALQFNLSQYQYIQEIIDPRFGEVKLYRKNETGELICIIEKILNSQQNFVKLEHPNLLKVYYYKLNTHKVNNNLNQEMCQSFSKLYIVYEYVSNDLKTLINNRIKKLSYFSEQQLWSLLNQGLSALNYFKSLGIYPLDLRNIYVSNQGMLKFNSILDNQMSSYMQLVTEITDDVHVSPEELQCLKNKQYCSKNDSEKCEIFQLGLTALWAASLEDTSTLFNKQEWKINESDLKNRIQSLNYSYEFKQLISIMLSINPLNRGSFSDLLQTVNNQKQDQNLTKISNDQIFQYPKQQIATTTNNHDGDEYEYHSQTSNNYSNRKQMNQNPYFEPNQNKITQLQKQISLIGSITLKDENQEINKANYLFRNNAREQENEVHQQSSKSLLQIRTLDCSPIQSDRKTPPFSASKNQLNHTFKPVIRKLYQQQQLDTSYMSQQSLLSNNKSQRSLLENKVEEAIMKSKQALNKFDAVIKLNNYYQH